MSKLNVLKIIFSIYLLLGLSLNYSTAQLVLSTKNKKAIAYFQEADLYLQQRKFPEGIALLEKAIEKDSNFFEAHLRLGSAHRIMLNHGLAKKHIFKACTLRPEQKDLAGAYFMVAEYFFKDNNYAVAKEFANKTIQYTIQESLKSQARKVIAESDFSIAQLAVAPNINRRKMVAPLNKYYLQSFPVLTADGENLIFFKRDGTKPTDSEDVMICTKENDKWSVPISISDSINTKYNEGMCTIAGDGRTLVFTSCKRPDGIEQSCDIYVSYKRGNEWSVPVNLGNNVNSKYWDSEPCLSADGNTIFFSSDRKGGLGKEDIYMTTKDERGIWSVAKNLGKPINSIGREVSPMIFANSQTLFFATDNRIGMGGFDIFYTQINDSSLWSTPVNIGAPINSSENDVSLFITSNGQKGYYSIDEKQEGMMHYTRGFLYEFDVPPALKAALKKTIYIKGKITDADTKANIGAGIELLDLATGKVIQKVFADDVSGEYILVLAEGKEYDLHVQNDKYLFHSSYIDFRKHEAFDSKKADIALKPLKTGSSIVLNNVFFNTNDYKLDQKSKTELLKLAEILKKNNPIKIEISGHTDTQGTEIDNQTLSQKRAKEVAAFLINQGIISTRLQTKGYGSTKPITPNDSDAGRAMNRRIELKIIAK